MSFFAGISLFFSLACLVVGLFMLLLRRFREAGEAEQKCLADLQCVDKRLSREAIVQCSEPIEKLAKYSYDWEGWMIVRFSYLRWKNKKKGVVTMIGDKIKFQNGFGAWQYMTYECDMDAKEKTALDVRVHAGRLP